MKVKRKIKGKYYTFIFDKDSHIHKEKDKEILKKEMINYLIKNLSKIKDKCFFMGNHNGISYMYERKGNTIKILETFWRSDKLPGNDIPIFNVS